MILSLLSFPLPPFALCTIFGEFCLALLPPLVVPCPPAHLPLGSPWDEGGGGVGLARVQYLGITWTSLG